MTHPVGALLPAAVTASQELLRQTTEWSAPPDATRGRPALRLETSSASLGCADRPTRLRSARTAHDPQRRRLSRQAQRRLRWDQRVHLHLHLAEAQTQGQALAASSSQATPPPLRLWPLREPRHVRGTGAARVRPAPNRHQRPPAGGAWARPPGSHFRQTAGPARRHSVGPRRGWSRWRTPLEASAPKTTAS